MSDHEPKIAALLAYEAGELSPEGRRRVEAHLGTCEVCREALASMRVYDELVRDVKAEPVPEPDWSRMELALRREARRARRRIGPAVWVGLAAAAAAVLAFLYTQRGAPEETLVEAPRVEPGEARPEPARLRITGEVTAVVQGVSGGTDVLDPVEVGTPVREEMRIATASGALAHLRFYEGTGVVVQPDTLVKVEELREGRVTLALLEGAVASEVTPLGEGDRYAVRAGDYTVRVRGTRFAVVHGESGTAVTVDEGVVEVLRGGEVVATVAAPGIWRSDDDVEPIGEGQVPEPLALAPEAAGWPVLELPEIDWVRSWQVRGRELPPGAIAMRVPAGDCDVSALGDHGRSWRGRIVLAGEGQLLEPEAIRPSAPEVRVGTLAPALIAPVVERGKHGLRRCQRQVDLETGQTVVGQFTLRVTIGRTGEVQRAELASQGEPPPAAYRECVLSQVGNWTFPPPTGGIVTFEQPLRVGTVQ